jgi:glyoxylase-like metal-dependent hydrolase (beta-lactamase superfamily II)
MQGRVEIEDLGHGVSCIHMSDRVTRAFKMETCAFLVDDVLIDTGFAYVRKPLVDALAGCAISAICCTHNHEDHTANCAALARAHGCPVYLRRASALWEEGVGRMRPYRRRVWGAVERFTPEEMPDVIHANGRSIVAVPTPGHSQTHTAFFDEASGFVFSGDLFIARGVSAVMTHENPFESVASLRRVAALEPRVMLTGHGDVVDAPAGPLRDKADRIEDAAAAVIDLHARGWSTAAILRDVFPRGAAKDRLSAWMTEGEFSRANFVRACLIHADGRGQRPPD